MDDDPLVIGKRMVIVYNDDYKCEIKQKSINERRTQVSAIRFICRAEQYFLFTFRIYDICVFYAFFFYGYVDVAF